MTSTAMYSNPSTTQPNLVTLNVGGEYFTTTYETLTQGYAKDSMLSALTSTTLPTTRDNTGRIFIDRDSARFRVILNFLRCGTLHIVKGLVPCPYGGFLTLEQIEEEARFYGIEKLGLLITEESRRLDLEQFLEGLYQRRIHVCQCRQQLNCHSGGDKQKDGFTLDADF